MEVQNKYMAAKGNISYKDAGGHESSINFSVPIEVVAYLTILIIQWEERFSMTPRGYNDFLKSLQKMESKTNQ